MPHAFLRVLSTLHHLGLSAHRLYLLLCRFGEGGSLDGDALVRLPLPRTLKPYSHLLSTPASSSAAASTSLPASKALESGDVDLLQGLGKDVVEAALGDTPGEGHLAAFEADADAAAAPGLLALVAAAGGLAVAGAVTPALTLGNLGAAGGGESSLSFIAYPPYSSVTCRR